MKKTVAIALFFLLSFSLFTGCENEKEYGDFFYDLSTSADNLDPQTTSGYESMLILSNLMDGLVKYGQDGEIVPALAEQWEISPDGLTYTFHLREGIQWVDAKGKPPTENGAEMPVTAEDFLFAFQRLFTPENHAPYASRYHIIENGDEILAGQMPVDTLGVTAPDSKTLQIKLIIPSPQFLSLLTLPPAFACNQDFFP